MRRTPHRTIDALQVWVSQKAVLLVLEKPMLVERSECQVVTVLTYEQARKGVRRLKAFDPEIYAKKLSADIKWAEERKTKKRFAYVIGGLRRIKTRVVKIVKALQPAEEHPELEEGSLGAWTWARVSEAVLRGGGKSFAEIAYRYDLNEEAVKAVVEGMVEEGLVRMHEGNSYPQFEPLAPEHYMGSLVQYKQFVVTSDLAAALRQLEAAVNTDEVQLYVTGLEQSELSWGEPAKFVEGSPAHLDLAKTGRQVQARLLFKQDSGPSATKAQRALEALWGLMIPLGFTPWDRYPLVSSPTVGVMSFLGPWQTVFDHMLYLGRGEGAFSSVVRAASVDAGLWKADRLLESYVQAHLHRLGANAGPVDGVVGPQTLAAMQELGLKGKTMTEAADALKVREKASKVQIEQKKGNLYIPSGVTSSIVTSGQVTSVKGPSGAQLLVNGPGQVVVSLGVEE